MRLVVAAAGLVVIFALVAGMQPEIDTLTAGLQDAGGIAVAADGTAYVGDSGARQILKITPSGRSIVVAHTAGQPRSLALDRQGNLYFTQFATSALFRLTASGQIEKVPGNFRSPLGLAPAPDGGMFVADLDTIWRVEPDGSRAMWVAPDYPAFLVGGLAVDSSGALYFGNPGIHAVEKVEPNRSHVIVNRSAGIVDAWTLVVNRDGSMFVGRYGGLLKLYPDGGTREIKMPERQGLSDLATDRYGNLYATTGSAVYRFHGPIPGPPFYDVDPAVPGLLTFIAGAVITLLVYLRSTRRSAPLGPVRTIPAGGLFP